MFSTGERRVTLRHRIMLFKMGNTDDKDRMWYGVDHGRKQITDYCNPGDRRAMKDSK